MKNFYLCLIILPFFISCTNDMESSLKGDVISKTLNTGSTVSSTLRTTDEIPANSDNPYDIAGRLHTEFFEVYYGLENRPNTVAAIVNRIEFIASTDSVFNGLQSKDYHFVSADRVAYILSHPTTCVYEIIDGSELTVNAKLSLSHFIHSLLLLFDTKDSCETLYEFVKDYEAHIISNALLTENDKRVILITSSIARYSTYEAKKRPKKNTDPDWALMVGNIIAATDGANSGIAEAITMALASGIAENQ